MPLVDRHPDGRDLDVGVGEQVDHTGSGFRPALPRRPTSDFMSSAVNRNVQACPEGWELLVRDRRHWSVPGRSKRGVVIIERLVGRTTTLPNPLDLACRSVHPERQLWRPKTGSPKPKRAQGVGTRRTRRGDSSGATLLAARCRDLPRPALLQRKRLGTACGPIGPRLGSPRRPQSPTQAGAHREGVPVRQGPRPPPNTPKTTMNRPSRSGLAVVAAVVAAFLLLPPDFLAADGAPEPGLRRRPQDRFLALQERADLPTVPMAGKSGAATGFAN
jgi:hypothetical protein